jgi:DNA-binding XRE family transcriptional regulator
MSVVQRWTGRETRLLRHALRLTVRDFAEDLGVAPRTVTKWESGGDKHRPRPELQRALDTMHARAPDADRERFAEARAGSTGRQVVPPGRGPGASGATFLDAPARPAGGCGPLGEEYIGQLRREIRGILRLDGTYGGTVAGQVAATVFQRAQHVMRTAEIDRRISRDVHAVGAELAEVAAWSLYDAGRDQLARLMNHEALSLCRLAADLDMERFVLQNMAMHAGDLGSPRESLNIVRLVQQRGNMSPRVAALFVLREARALAQLGRAGEAREHLKTARSLHAEGISEADPHWAWWVDEQELSWHEGMISLDSGDLADVDSFEQAVSGISATRVRTRYIFRASALLGYSRNRSWAGIERFMGLLREDVGLVGSFRGNAMVLEALSHLTGSGGVGAPTAVHDLGALLRASLSSGPTRRQPADGRVSAQP